MASDGSDGDDLSDLDIATFSMDTAPANTGYKYQKENMQPLIVEEWAHRANNKVVHREFMPVDLEYNQSPDDFLILNYDLSTNESNTDPENSSHFININCSPEDSQPSELSLAGENSFSKDLLQFEESNTQFASNSVSNYRTLMNCIERDNENLVNKMYVHLDRQPNENLGMVLGIDGDHDSRRTINAVIVKSLTPGGAVSRSIDVNQKVLIGDEISEINGRRLNKLTHDECISALQEMPDNAVLTILRKVKCSVSASDQSNLQSSPTPAATAKNEVPVPRRRQNRLDHTDSNDMIFRRLSNDGLIFKDSTESHESNMLVRSDSFTDYKVPKGFRKLDVTLFKDEENSLGLSIVPSVGATCDLYQIKRFLHTGICARPGVLKPGDRLLSCNDHSLKGLTQAQCLNVLRQSGNFVNLTILRCIGENEHDILTREPSVDLLTSPDAEEIELFLNTSTVNSEVSLQDKQRVTQPLEDTLITFDDFSDSELQENISEKEKYQTILDTAPLVDATFNTLLNIEENTRVDSSLHDERENSFYIPPPIKFSNANGENIELPDRQDAVPLSFTNIDDLLIETIDDSFTNSCNSGINKSEITDRNTEKEELPLLSLNHLSDSAHIGVLINSQTNIINTSTLSAIQFPVDCFKNTEVHKVVTKEDEWGVNDSVKRDIERTKSTKPINNFNTQKQEPSLLYNKPHLTIIPVSCDNSSQNHVSIIPVSDVNNSGTHNVSNSVLPPSQSTTALTFTTSISVSSQSNNKISNIDVLTRKNYAQEEQDIEDRNVDTNNTVFYIDSNNHTSSLMSEVIKEGTFDMEEELDQKVDSPVLHTSVGVLTTYQPQGEEEDIKPMIVIKDSQGTPLCIPSPQSVVENLEIPKILDGESKREISDVLLALTKIPAKTASSDFRTNDEYIPEQEIIPTFQTNDQKAAVLDVLNKWTSVENSNDNNSSHKAISSISNAQEFINNITKNKNIDGIANTSAIKLNSDIKNDSAATFSEQLVHEAPLVNTSEQVVLRQSKTRANYQTNIDQFSQPRENDFSVKSAISRRPQSMIETTQLLSLASISDAKQKSVSNESKVPHSFRPLSAMRPLSASSATVHQVGSVSSSRPCSGGFTSSTFTTKANKLDYPKTRQEDGSPFQVDVLKGIVGLGFKVRVTPDGHTQVTEIQPGGPIHKDGQVRVGDYLLYINSTELTGQTDARVQQILRLLPRGLTKLVISSSLPTGSLESQLSLESKSYGLLSSKQVNHSIDSVDSRHSLYSAHASKPNNSDASDANLQDLDLSITSAKIPALNLSKVHVPKKEASPVNTKEKQESVTVHGSISSIRSDSELLKPVPKFDDVANTVIEEIKIPNEIIVSSMSQNVNGDNVNNTKISLEQEKLELRVESNHQGISERTSTEDQALKKVIDEKLNLKQNQSKQLEGSLVLNKEATISSSSTLLAPKNVNTKHVIESLDEVLKKKELVQNTVASPLEAQNTKAHLDSEKKTVHDFKNEQIKSPIAAPRSLASRDLNKVQLSNEMQDKNKSIVEEKSEPVILKSKKIPPPVAPKPHLSPNSFRKLKESGVNVENIELPLKATVIYKKEQDRTQARRPLSLDSNTDSYIPSAEKLDNKVENNNTHSEPSLITKRLSVTTYTDSNKTINNSLLPAQDRLKHTHFSNPISLSKPANLPPATLPRSNFKDAMHKEVVLQESSSKVQEHADNRTSALNSPTRLNAALSPRRASSIDSPSSPPPSAAIKHAPTIKDESQSNVMHGKSLINQQYGIYKSTPLALITNKSPVNVVAHKVITSPHSDNSSHNDFIESHSKSFISAHSSLINSKNDETYQRKLGMMDNLITETHPINTEAKPIGLSLSSLVESNQQQPSPIIEYVDKSTLKKPVALPRTKTETKENKLELSNTNKEDINSVRDIKELSNTKIENRQETDSLIDVDDITKHQFKTNELSGLKENIDKLYNSSESSSDQLNFVKETKSIPVVSPNIAVKGEQDRNISESKKTNILLTTNNHKLIDSVNKDEHLILNGNENKLEQVHVDTTDEIIHHKVIINANDIESELSFFNTNVETETETKDIENMAEDDTDFVMLNDQASQIVQEVFNKILNSPEILFSNEDKNLKYELSSQHLSFEDEQPPSLPGSPPPIPGVPPPPVVQTDTNLLDTSEDLIYKNNFSVVKEYVADNLEKGSTNLLDFENPTSLNSVDYKIVTKYSNDNLADNAQENHGKMTDFAHELTSPLNVVHYDSDTGVDSLVIADETNILVNSQSDQKKNKSNNNILNIDVIEENLPAPLQATFTGLSAPMTSNTSASHSDNTSTKNDNLFVQTPLKQELPPEHSSTEIILLDDDNVKKEIRDTNFEATSKSKDDLIENFEQNNNNLLNSIDLATPTDLHVPENLIETTNKQLVTILSKRKWCLKSSKTMTNVLSGKRNKSVDVNYAEFNTISSLEAHILKSTIERANVVLDAASVTESFTMIVVHWKQHGEQTTKDVALKHEDGIWFEVVSGSLLNNWLLDECGAEVGDWLLSVDDIWCDNASVEDFQSKLACPKHDLLLVFARGKKPINAIDSEKPVPSPRKRSTHKLDENITVENSLANSSFEFKDEETVHDLLENKKTLASQLTSNHLPEIAPSLPELAPSLPKLVSEQTLPSPKLALPLPEQAPPSPKLAPPLPELAPPSPKLAPPSQNQELPLLQKLPPLSDAPPQEISSKQEIKAPIVSKKSSQTSNGITTQPVLSNGTLNETIEQKINTKTLTKSEIQINSSSTNSLPEKSVNSTDEMGPGIHKIIMIKGATGVGFCLEGGMGSPKGDLPVTIKRIFKGGPAEKCGKLKVNDEILEVNGIKFDSMRHYEAWNHLKFLDDGEVHMTVRRF